MKEEQTQAGIHTKKVTDTGTQAIYLQKTRPVVFNVEKRKANVRQILLTLS